MFGVAELTVQVKRLLESHFGVLWVAGEVSNLRVQSSGHCYFTLKDPAAQLNCVLFRGPARAGRELLADGRQVLLRGELSVYEPRGQYQLVVSAVEARGAGALQAAFEQLKQRLSQEGLFDPARKRTLPRIPRCIGLVTSATGAALRDVLHVAGRRHPGLLFLIAPCRVQGEEAAAEIAEAIEHLNAFADSVLALDSSPATAGVGGLPRPDVILVTRGGGSLEDLWPFNEERVARAIVASALPVMSAVGHEVDFTISDFVADVRAATPSAAAEMLSEGAMAARQVMEVSTRRLGLLVRKQWETRADEVGAVAARLARAHPRRQVQDRWQRLDEGAAGLSRGARLRLWQARTRWEVVGTAWQRLRPARRLSGERESLERVAERLKESSGRRLERMRHDLEQRSSRLRLLSPVQTLARGYSITRDAETGRILRSPDETVAGRALQTRVLGGEIRSVVQGA